MNTQAQELREAVFSTQTNYILKKMVAKLRNSRSKRELMNILGVDFQTTSPIYFTGAYRKKEHENNKFVFLDEQFKIIGILEGNTWDEKKYAKFEEYDKKSSYNYGNYVIKNRRNMTETAAHILMITPEMKPTFPQKQKALPRIINKKQAKDKLHSRLYKYKTEKHDSITDLEIQIIIEKSLILCSTNLFNPIKRKELVTKLNKVFGWHRNEDELNRHISDIAELGQKYLYNKEKHEDFIKRNDGMDSEYNWYGSDLKKCKINIASLKKELEGEI